MALTIDCGEGRHDDCDGTIRGASWLNPQTAKSPDRPCLCDCHDYQLKPTPRPFLLQRDIDESGISGAGVVAEGVVFSDGSAALRWCGNNPTSVVFHDKGIESIEKIRGHNGTTRIVWVD